MDDRSQNSSVALKRDFDKVKRERFGEKFEYVSLSEVPLEDRRRQAKKPLFLTRYE